MNLSPFKIIKWFKRSTNNKRKDYFIYFSFFLVFGIQILRSVNDWLNNPIKSVVFNKIETLTIFLFFLFLLLLSLMFIKDLTNKESRSSAWELLKKAITNEIKDIQKKINTLKHEYNTNEEWINNNTILQIIFNSGITLFIISICATSTHVVLNNFLGTSIITDILRNIALPFSFIGTVMIIYSFLMNPIIRRNVLLSISNSLVPKEFEISISPLKGEKYVINPKSKDDYHDARYNNDNKLFRDILERLKGWKIKNIEEEYIDSENDKKVRYTQREKKYVDQFIRLLRRSKYDRFMYKINPEEQIGNTRQEGRGDLIINNNILVEVKCSNTSGSMQRAKGQIQEYAESWKKRGNKGPIILLLFDYRTKDAEDFQKTMEILWKQFNCQALTILAKEK